MRTVYVLQSVKDPTRHYIGRANDVDIRLEEHSSGRSSTLRTDFVLGQKRLDRWPKFVGNQ